MENCPKCNERLNIDEKSSGRCFSCGATFSSTIPKDDEQASFSTYSNASDNVVAKVVKALGVIIIVLGTIVSFVITHDNFSLAVFLEVEFFCVVGGMLLIGFAEIIKLLEDIKDKL